MHILLAFDKFKGSLTAKDASEAVARGLRKHGASFDLEICPIADGGEGFTDAVMTALGGTWCEAPVLDAQGRSLVARYGVIQREGHREAVMEMSAASGLALVSDLPLNPAMANTFGTGQLMRHALEQRVDRILIGIGGSATNDGGSGMAAALGYEFLTQTGERITELPLRLDQVARIVGPGRFPCEVVVACDVTNPLLGEHGATRVYGPQKGVKDFAYFESRLERMANVIERDLGSACRECSGAGAAGGLGFGLMSFCGARLQAGFDLVADVTELSDRMKKADIVVTGEGRLDSQTLHGKGPCGVARMARDYGKRVIGVGGLVEKSPAMQELFDHLIEVKPASMAVPEAMRRAGELLEMAAFEHARGILGN